MGFIDTPNMNLPVPTVGQEPGPEYAFDVNTCFSLIDQHDHSSGRGVQITPSGLNINAALTFADNPATNLKAAVFQAQTSLSTLQALYVKPGSESPSTINDLWFNDGAGNAVQITSNGATYAPTASIPGESYAAGTFTWKQGAGSTTPANFDIGSITLRPNTAATTNGILLGPPTGIATFFSQNLPPLPVGNPAFMAMDTSGNMSVPTPLIGTALQFLQTPTVGTSPVWATFKTPNVQVLSGASTQTYTTPTGALYLRVQMVGGGGSGGSNTAGASGTNSIFGDWQAGRGGAGGASTAANGGAGGGSTGNTIGTGTLITSATGGYGGSQGGGAFGGGTGGASYYGGGGAGCSTNNAGAVVVAAQAGSAFGSGGGGTNNGSVYGAGGGGAGSYLEFIITSPSATYSYSVGPGATTGGGAAGANGTITVTAYFQ